MSSTNDRPAMDFIRPHGVVQAEAARNAQTAKAMSRAAIAKASDKQIRQRLFELDHGARPSFDGELAALERRLEALELE